MVLIVGLGNPGIQYATTRHNIGFMVVDRFREIWQGSDWQLNSKVDSEISALEVDGQKVSLLKPQTFMNLSGESVKKWLQFYKPNRDDLQIVIVHDEVDVDFKKMKIQRNGGTAGHHGVESVYQHVGKDVVRIRVGIGRPTVQFPTSNSQFSIAKEQFASADEMKKAAIESGQFCAYGSLKDWVLAPFAVAELESVSLVAQRVSEALEVIIKQGVDQAMGEFNRDR